MHPHVEGVETVPIIHGDALSASIAAASVVAKVTRDRLMQKLDQVYPQYGLAQNKGYGSQLHMDAIRNLFEPENGREDAGLQELLEDLEA